MSPAPCWRYACSEHAHSFPLDIRDICAGEWDWVESFRADLGHFSFTPYFRGAPAQKENE